VKPQIINILRRGLIFFPNNIGAIPIALHLANRVQLSDHSASSSRSDRLAQNLGHLNWASSFVCNGTRLIQAHFMKTSTKIAVFYDVMLCSLVDIYQSC
jgi:hypothetical protein